MNKLKGPYSPHPARPKLRVRLEEDGPFVDLGISYSELIVGMLDALDDLCAAGTKVKLPVNLQKALNNLDAYRAPGRSREQSPRAGFGGSITRQAKP